MNAESLEGLGWKKLVTEGHTGIIGPFWIRGQGASREVGLIAEARHCNNHLGTVHGGVLMTVSDVGMGFGVVDELGSPKCATADLQIQFISSAKVGDFLVCKPELMRSSKNMIFMRGVIFVAEKVVAATHGIWKVF